MGHRVGFIGGTDSHYGLANQGSYHVDDGNAPVFSAKPNRDVWEGQWADDAPLSSLANAPTFPGDQPFVFYYVRIRQANRQRAWSSPFWLTDRG